MNLKTQRRMASEILKCGTHRVRIEETKDVEEALTRSDIRRLIVKGVITKVPIKGTSRKNAKKILAQKKKGRRSGRGSRKGTRGAVQNSKDAWMKKIRALRKTIRELRDDKQITVSQYRTLYMRVKGNAFRNKRHLLSYLKENEMIKKETKPTKAEKTKTEKKVTEKAKKTTKKAKEVNK